MNGRPAFRPLAQYVCRHCGKLIGAAENSIYCMVGAQVIAYCGPEHAARAGVWPWTNRTLWSLLPPAPRSPAPAGHETGREAGTADLFSAGFLDVSSQKTSAESVESRARRLFGADTP